MVLPARDGPTPCREATPTGLGLSQWSSGSSVVLSVTGEIDLATIPELSKALTTALSSAPHGLIADLSGVGHLGSAGLAVLLDARRLALSGGSRFDLACPAGMLRRVVELAGLTGSLSFYDSVAEAAAAQASLHGCGSSTGVGCDPDSRPTCVSAPRTTGPPAKESR